MSLNDKIHFTIITLYKYEPCADITYYIKDEVIHL